MRKIEERLSDIGLDFLPLGGRNSVLKVWESLPETRQANTVAIVDLDLWLIEGIPSAYQGTNIIYTKGYSIENDIFVDAGLLNLCEPAERSNFAVELGCVAAAHAREIKNAVGKKPFCLSHHVNAIIAGGDISDDLDHEEDALKTILTGYYGQVLRGKNLLQLLVRQLTRPGRYANIGYKQVYEFGSANLGPNLLSLESDLRTFFSNNHLAA